MRANLLLCSAFWLCASFCLHAQQLDAPANFSVAPATREAIRNLIGETMLNGKSYDYARELADGIGPRLTGSANYVRAVTWAQEQFRALGMDVHTENWTIAATWEPDIPAVGHIVTPVDHTLHIYAAGWSPSTKQGGVNGKVIYIPSLDLPALDAQRAELAGAIALVDDATLAKSPTTDKLFSGLEHLRSLSVVAILLPGGPNGTEELDCYSYTGAIDLVPEAEIGEEDVLLVRRLLQHGPVTVEFTLKNRIHKDVQISNVVAEIPGAELSQEVVLVGAHLDSWQPGTGAQDNGTGVAGLLETARAIQALHRPPKRTIRFVLFGGEEEGMLGSTAYARQHRADMGKIDAVLITDSGSEPAKGWYVMGRESEREPLAAISPLLAELGADGVSLDTQYIFETDHIGFEVLGVPTLVLWTGMDKYMNLHHKASDTFDSIIPKDLAQGTSVIAIAAYALADSSRSFAPHLSSEEVDSMFRQSGHFDEYEYLKKVGALP